MAIAFDAATDGGYSASGGKTFAHTCTGSNRLLLVNTWGKSGSDTVTGVTYNGVAMTKITAVQCGGTDLRYTTAWYLINPASGSNNVVVSVSSGDCYGHAVSYTGANQTAQPDSYNTNTATATSLTTSTTVVASDCWGIYFVHSNDGEHDLSAGTGSTSRVVTGAYSIGTFDSNGTIATGSRSMTATLSVSHEMAGIMFSIAPQAYTVALAYGSYTLTGQSLAFLRGLRLALSQGSYTLTGQALSFLYNRIMTLAYGAYTYTGKALAFVSGGWIGQSKHSATWTPESKHSATWTPESKHSATWTNETKHST